MNKAEKLIRELAMTFMEADGDKYDRSVFLYMEPANASAEEQKEFAQCSTCVMWTGEACFIHGTKDKLSLTDAEAKVATCLLYVSGKPNAVLAGKEVASVTPETSGFVRDHNSRCENCRSFDNGTCKMFQHLNETQPDFFELDANVKALGCCNLQVNP